MRDERYVPQLYYTIAPMIPNQEIKWPIKRIMFNNVLMRSFNKIMFVWF